MNCTLLADRHEADAQVKRDRGSKHKAASLHSRNPRDPGRLEWRGKRLGRLRKKHTIAEQSEHVRVPADPPKPL
jgi:hypothetical protein